MGDLVKGLASAVSFMNEFKDTIFLVIKAFVAWKVAKAVAVVDLTKLKAGAASTAAVFNGAYAASLRVAFAATANLSLANIRLITTMASLRAAAIATAVGIRALGAGLVGLAGGPIGVAIFAVWGLYEAYQALIGSQKEIDALIKNQPEFISADQAEDIADRIDELIVKKNQLKNR